jgi:multiple sugar transport system substrate-binding protein
MKVGLPLRVIGIVLLVVVGSFGLVQASAPAVDANGETVDFNGETVTIVSWLDLQSQFQEGGRAPGRVEEAEKLFNCNIEFVLFPHGGYPDTYMARFLAGDSVNDIWLMHTYYFWYIVAQGAFFPLDTVLPAEYYENMPAMGREVIEGGRYQGHTYGAGVYYQVGELQWFTAYNKTLLEREQLPDPYELYLKGEWTWDALTEIARAATRDTDGDGVVDQWGMARIVDFQYPEFMMTNNAHSVEIAEDGTVKFALDSPNSLEGFRQYYQWQTVDKVIGGFRNEFAAGKVAFIHQPLYSILGAIGTIKDEFGIVPLPKGPAQDEYIYPTGGTQFLVPLNAKNPAGLVAVLDYLWPHDEYEEQAIDYLMKFAQTEEAFEVLLEGFENPAASTWELNRFMLSQEQAAFAAIVNGEKTPAAAMAEIKPEVQAILDEVFGQK